MTKEDFDAAAYWESRLHDYWGPHAVGYLGLGQAYNRALYRVKARVFERAVRRLGVDIERAKVLDVGSGTGFVVQCWEALGVAHLRGCDISPFAVSQLRARYPRYDFLRLDIGSPGAVDVYSRGSFDCISALDVLYHIVDDAAYQRALTHIGQALRPGGYPLLADNFVHRGTIRGRHQVSHSIDTLRGWLGDADLAISYRTPQYVVMNYPVDSERRFLHWWWQRLRSQLAKGERRGLWLGRALAPVDILLTRCLREGPSTELAICQKVGSSRPR